MEPLNTSTPLFAGKLEGSPGGGGPQLRPHDAVRHVSLSHSCAPNLCSFN